MNLDSLDSFGKKKKKKKRAVDLGVDDGKDDNKENGEWSSTIMNITLFTNVFFVVNVDQCFRKCSLYFGKS